MKKILLFLISGFIFTACKSENTNEHSSIEVFEQHLKPEKNKKYLAFGDSHISGYNSKWELIIGDSNNVTLLRTFTSKHNDFNKNDSQFFFKVKKSDQNNLELIPQLCLNASGCNKPRHPFLYSDTSAINIDSLCIKSIKDGRFRITSELGYDTTFPVNSQQHLFRTIQKNGALDTSSFIITYEPPIPSKIKSFTIVGGNRCGTYISNYCASNKYFLTRIDSIYNLIIFSDPNQFDTLKFQ